MPRPAAERLTANQVRGFRAAAITFLVGAGAARMRTIGTPVALTSIAFLAGLALPRLAEETKGKELPA